MLNEDEIESGLLGEGPIAGDIWGVGAATTGVASVVNSIFGNKSISKQIKADAAAAKADAQYEQQRLRTLTTGAVVVGVLAIGAILVYGATKRGQ